MPLKTYHSFFVEKVKASSGWVKIAWIIGYVVTAVFAYPIFGLLALLGIGVKLLGIPSLCSHNATQIRYVEGKRLSIKNTRGYSTDSQDVIEQDGYEMQVIQQFDIDKANVDAQSDVIMTLIRRYSWQMRKIHLQAQGTIWNGEGKITISLCTHEISQKV